MYCSTTALSARFGALLLTRLTDDNGLGVIDETKVTPAITAIESEIDGYLRGRYPLPLSSVPAELTGYAEDMILERIYSGKPERETPKDVKDRAAAARSWLRDLKAGRAELNLPIETVPAASPSANQIRIAEGTSPLSTALERY